MKFQCLPILLCSTDDNLLFRLSHKSDPVITLKLPSLLATSMSSSANDYNIMFLQNEPITNKFKKTTTMITALQQKPKSLAVSLPRSAEDYDLASRVQLMIILTYM